MVDATPTKILLTTPLRPLVGQRSGPLAQGVRLLDQFLHDALTPWTRAECARQLRALLREVGWRSRAWGLNHLEPESEAEAAARLRFAGPLYRRRGKSRSTVAPLFGTVPVWRRL